MRRKRPRDGEAVRPVPPERPLTLHVLHVAHAVVDNPRRGEGELFLFSVPNMLLCSEPRADMCHRRLVAEYLAGKWGGGEVEHL